MRLHMLSFGYGEAICPNCYKGEEEFIFLDKSYWLNRILSSLIKQDKHQQVEDLDEIMLERLTSEDHIIIPEN